MKIEGSANLIEEEKLVKDSTPQPLQSPIEEDSQQLDSCIDHSSNTNNISSPFRTKEHARAKTNGRVELCQHFIALAAIVPGIKKMDEVTVLENSISYMKHLQERVRTLEEKTSNQTMESDANYYDEAEPLPEIEAQVCDRHVLIRIQCEIRKGVLVQALLATEKLNLRVVHSHVMPFGTSHEITLVAQMDDEFIMTVKDLVKSLRSSLIQFMGKNLPREYEN